MKKAKEFFTKREGIEWIVGVVVLLATLILGLCLFPKASKGMLFFRMLIGLAIGYALTRAAMGFAGTVNRAYRTGSTKLMRAIACAFIFGAIGSAVLKATGVITTLPGNKLDWGTLIGAPLFGFGMAMTICCASGVLTDLAESPLRALIVIFFFGAGVFLGKALVKQEWMAWAGKPIFGIEALGDASKLNFTYWFRWDGANGAFGGLILTLILCGLLIWLSKLYENRRQRLNTYTACESEEHCTEVHKEDPEKQGVFYRIFVKPWNMKTGAAVLGVCFTLLLVVTKGGWGVSGPLGMWFARFLHLFGLPTDAITKFAGYGAGAITGPFFENAMFVQDSMIFVGALVALLLSGRFLANPKGWLFNPLEIIFYAFGGICLGLAINLAHGCNAGGLYSPIAGMSTSGWVYLICLIAGGWLGNFVVKKLYKAFKITK